MMPITQHGSPSGFDLRELNRVVAEIVAPAVSF